MPAPASQTQQTTTTAGAPSENPAHHRPRRNGPRRPRNNPPDGATSRPPDATPDDPGLTPHQSDQPHRASRGPSRPRPDGEPAQRGGGRPRAPRRRNPNGGALGGASGPPSVTNSDNDGVPTGTQSGRPPRANRRGNFGSGLSKPGDHAEGATTTAPSQRHSFAIPDGDDLTSSLIRDLRTPPYPDCPICFNSIHPAQPSWSCSPSSPIAAAAEGQDAAEVGASDTAQCCWTTFHLKCIKSWAGKSVKDLADAWRARGEERSGEWRCPGCQAKRIAVPSGYWCFCGFTVDPKPPRLATPHSCANACSRPRACGHACPLTCHPGPCPPCQVTTSLPCHCGKETLSFRCGRLAPTKNGRARADVADLSCTAVCGKKLACGNHVCQQTCHPGECLPCTIREVVKCYCGKEEREVPCGEGDTQDCSVGDESWYGRFQCTRPCDRPFDCGTHHCLKDCHPPSRLPAPCPRSPSLLTRCPCGKHPIDPSSSSFFPPNATLLRTSCKDPVPTCTSICMRPLEGCSHVCSSPCHTGPCPPCSILLVRPCRCGAITRDVKCSSADIVGEILCDRPCVALRACGRHRCNRVCCPLASLAIPAGKGKGKKRATTNAQEDLDGAVGSLHECDLVCGKPLTCGNHRCEERDHRGACPPCLRSSFDELVCNCGRTVLMPPIPCGTRVNCTRPCARPPPLCGHSRTPHACHEDPTPCPPCPFLTRKACACGKKTVDNVRCSQEKISCGTSCGKLLACGFHRCQKLCHGDDCGACTSACGKPRKLCLPAIHPCAHPCHAPSACSEAEPCMATITLTCSCGRIRQSSPCGRSTSNPAGREGVSQIKCSNECAIAKRNARLAEALGITTGGGSKAPATYSDELQSYARANLKFLGVAEKGLHEFVTSDKKTQVLPHMPPDRRKFVHDLAAVYRMDAQMVDQEPQRSVQLIRRIDTRVPSPLLSAVVGNSPSSAHALGKLSTEVRGGSRPAASSVRTTVAPAKSAVGAGRGWTSVVAKGPTPVASAWATQSRPETPAARGVATIPPLTQANMNTAQVSGEEVPDSWEDDL